MAASGIKRRKIELMLDDLEGLPSLPGLVQHALRTAAAEHPTRRDLQMPVEVDPALAANLLRLAVALDHPAEDLDSVDALFEALEPDAIRSRLLSTEAAPPEALEAAQLPTLWRHTLAVAVAAQITAQRLGTVRPERALLAGLLHDIGQVALRVLMPRAYAQVLDHLETSGGDLIEAERRLLGIDHAILGKRLARRWGFSEALQNLIWLHHQADVPDGQRPGVGALSRIVRLADLLARQYGHGYYAAEQIVENPAEVAERLGLSGAQMEHIGRQLASAVDLNARAVGLDDRPTEADLAQAYRAAGAALGRLHRAHYRTLAAERAEARHARRLVALGAHLAELPGPREVMEEVARAIHETLPCRVVVPYLLAREGGYVEGLRYRPGRGTEDYFLYDLQGIEDLLPPTEPVPPESVGRAERQEAWLLDRQGPALGPGPLFTVPMYVGPRRVGGIVFGWDGEEDEPPPHLARQVADVARVAGLALRRAQAEADLVALSEELADANRRLEAAHRAALFEENVASLGEMALGAAHEINNPLAIISGRAQQLAADEQDPQRKKALDIIVQQAERISEIIAELRAFARPPAPARAPVDPADLVRAVVEAERPKDPASPVRVEASGTDQPVPPIQVDRDQVAAALAEVVRNAVQACEMAGRGTVTVRAAALPAEEAVCLIVSDEGPGMSPEVRARAFDPFYSGPEEARRHGLGLPRAYRTVEANGGRMTLESIPGGGTTVRMTFPVAEARAPASRKGQGAAQGTDGNPEAAGAEAAEPGRPTPPSGRPDDHDNRRTGHGER